MTRHNRPIEDHPLGEGINTGIAKSQHLMEWDAAIAAGATLGELYMWEMAGYPSWFKAMVYVWYERHILGEAHVEDAKAKAIKSRKRS
jgi:hypothetical protein